MSAATAAAEHTGRADRSRSTQALLQAPLVPTLFKLATPNVLGLLATTLVIAYDGWIVGRLGVDALAGVALVFPVSMLMSQMSAGAIGGTVAAAVARALGAGNRDQADRIAIHAVWVAALMAAVFGVLLVGFGSTLFSAFGARGATLRAALDYSNVLFAGALAIWLTNLLGGVVRGGGNMLLPSLVLALVAVVHLLLCPLLVFGSGSWAGLGVAGAACSMVISQLVAASVLAGWLLRGRGAVRLQPSRWRPHAPTLKSLLGTGLVTSLSPLLSNLSIATATALVAGYGTAALAGFGLAARLEFIVVPIAFGFGSALTTMVATNIGAGQRERALRAAWTGAGVVAALTGAIGVTVALVPGWWMNHFSSDPEILAFGSRYLRIVGACYGFFGVGLALFFASQGAGRLFWPLVASVSRLLVVAIGGVVVIKLLGADIAVLFGVVAAGLVTYAVIIASAICFGRWTR